MLKRKRIQPILQHGQNECALACVAMVANYHGLNKSINTLRSDFPFFSRGATLRDLMECANRLGLTSRPLKVDLEFLRQLELPSILHFDFDHFVVLVEIRKDYVVVADPASGSKKFSFEELAQRYTGVAVELRPSPSFQPNFDVKAETRIDFLSATSHWQPITKYVVINTTVLSLSLLAPLSIQVLVDKVIPTQDYYLLVVLTLAFLLVNLALVLGRWFSNLFNTKKSLALKYFQTSKYLERLMKNPLSYFANKPLGHFVAQYNSIQFLVNHIVHDIGSAITDMLFIAVLIIILLLISPSIAAIIVATSLFVVALRWLIVRKASNLQNQVVITESQDEAYFVETLRGIFSVKANRLELVRQLGGVDKVVNSINASYASAVFQMRYEIGISSLKAIESSLLIFLLVQGVLGGKLTIGAMYTFYMFAKLLEERLANYVATIANILNIKVHQNRLREPFELSYQFGDDRATIAPHLKLKGDVAIENVSYKISPSITLFDGLSFIFPKGQFTHVAGASGIGKSTLLKIILGNAQPESGRVTIDGFPLSSIPETILKNNVGVVLQEDTLFSGSIAENVSSFDEYIDFDRVQECCKLCSCHEDVVLMPMNYFTQIGDMGSELSSGQKQRLLLARAIYKNPAILILDEATANLDPITERSVLDSLKSLRKTIIFASHSSSVAEVSDNQLKLPRDA